MGETAIVDGGRIVAAGSLVELRDMMGEQDLLRLSGKFEPAATEKAIAALTGAELVSVDSENLMVSARNASGLLPRLFASLAEVGAEIRATTLSQASLESLFIKLTGRELRE